MAIYREIPDPQSFYADLEDAVEEMVNSIITQLKAQKPVAWTETGNQAAAYEAYKRFVEKGYIVTEVKARQRQDGGRELVWYFSVSLPPYSPR